MSYACMQDLIPRFPPLKRECDRLLLPAMLCNLAQVAHDERGHGDRTGPTPKNKGELKKMCSSFRGGDKVPCKLGFVCEVTMPGGGTREAIDEKLGEFASLAAKNKVGMWYTFAMKAPRGHGESTTPAAAPETTTRLAIVRSRPSTRGCVHKFLKSHLIFHGKPPTPEEMSLHCLAWANKGLSFNVYETQLNPTNATLCVEKRNCWVILAIPDRFEGLTEQMRANAGKRNSLNQQGCVSAGLPVTKLRRAGPSCQSPGSDEEMIKLLGSPSSNTRSKGKLAPGAAGTPMGGGPSSATETPMAPSPLSAVTIQMMGPPVIG